MLRPSALAACWLRLAVAVLALLGGEGLHALLHEHADGGPLPAASGHIEAHAGDCRHRQDLPAPYPHACLICKIGPVNEAPPPSFDNTFLHAPARRLVPANAVACVPCAFLPGVLGARGPPVPTA